MQHLVSSAFVLVSLALASPACQHAPVDGAAPPPVVWISAPLSPPSAAPPARPAAAVIPADAMKWQRKKIASFGISLEFFAGDKVVEVFWPGGGGTLFQSYPIGKEGSVLLSIRAETDAGLEAFRQENKGWTIAQPSAATACGKPAQIQRATRDAEHIACVKTSQGNHPLHIPPGAAIAVVFEHRGRPVRVTWEAESYELGALDALKDHFIASVRCD